MTNYKLEKHDGKEWITCCGIYTGDIEHIRKQSMHHGVGQYRLVKIVGMIPTGDKWEVAIIPQDRREGT